MLQPTTDWHWYCDKQYLMLSLKHNLQFQTAYNIGRLLNVPADKQFFSMLDSERYMQLAEQLEASHLNVGAAEMTQILLNAIAAITFHKPVTLRSWYFCEQNHAGAIRQLASLENQDGKGNVLILEQEQHVATCMVISQSLILNANKQLQKFELVKVMKNRLIPYIAPAKQLSQTA
ncbi:cell division protein ZapC domain-containing protein [Paraglaciecola sp. 25GB23A]|uniref:cell division protein ZapC domain-containing protein n=1 Tax=Paraglaciecola sp. 25GB23A TaxID=3156068 RepID=UPI0032AEEF7B